MERKRRLLWLGGWWGRGGVREEEGGNAGREKGGRLWASSSGWGAEGRCREVTGQQWLGLGYALGPP